MKAMLTVSESWKTTSPGAAAGILAMRGVSNPEHHAGLEARRVAAWGYDIEARLDLSFADVKDPLDDTARDDRTEVFAGLSAAARPK